MEEQLAPSAVVQNKEQLIPGLEGHIKPHNERVLHVAKHVSLRLRMLHLFSRAGTKIASSKDGCNASGTKSRLRLDCCLLPTFGYTLHFGGYLTKPRVRFSVRSGCYYAKLGVPISVTRGALVF